MMLLEVENLTKTYGPRAALKGINLSVKKGEILALLGPTGAGKSSTLMCIAGLTKPEQGAIRIDGADMTSADPRLRDVAVVFEGFNLLPTLSVYDNIAFPLRSPAYRQPDNEVQKRVQKAAQDLRIAHLLDRMTDQLSGGERQRVAIARALVRDPLLHLLDEPLSALDLKLRESLRAELRSLQQQKSATILYATHDYHGAAAIADRIALISGGRILQIDTLDRLIADPASMEVGRLIGSPSMALFPGRIEGSALKIDGYDPPLSIAGPTASHEIVAGCWPEDIEISEKPVKSFQQASIHATDFRGMDRAIQAGFGNCLFRKAVPLSSDVQEGDCCWFRLPPEALFLFNRKTGQRLRLREHDA
jgi:ABC-type sugar transport system ATPase subunit